MTYRNAAKLFLASCANLICWFLPFRIGLMTRFLRDYEPDNASYLEEGMMQWILPLFKNHYDEYITSWQLMIYALIAGLSANLLVYIIFTRNSISDNLPINKLVHSVLVLGHAFFFIIAIIFLFLVAMGPPMPGNENSRHFGD